MTRSIIGVPTFLALSDLERRLKDMVKERSAKDADITAAIQQAIENHSHISTFAFCDDNITIDGTGCGMTMPCCGITNYELWVRNGCPDCYEYMDSTIECGMIRSAVPMRATGKLMIYGNNAYILPAHTVSQPSYDSALDEWTIYVDGQPEIPPFGFCSICGDVYFYYCRAPRTWAASAGIVPQDWMYTEEDETEFLPEESHGDPDFSELPGYQPAGTHTALKLIRSIQCGRGDEVDLAAVAMGTEVEFPLAFMSMQQANVLLYAAAEHLYVRLISSCRSQKDVDRFQAMNDYYEQRYTRAIATMPRIKKHRLRTRHANNFRRTRPLHSRWPSSYDGSSSRVGCCN